MGWSGIEVFYTPGSPHCRAVLMCIKALDLEVDLTKLDMYQKFEHRKPWFVKVRIIYLQLINSFRSFPFSSFFIQYHFQNVTLL